MVTHDTNRVKSLWRSDLSNTTLGTSSPLKPAGQLAIKVTLTG